MGRGRPEGGALAPVVSGRCWPPIVLCTPLSQYSAGSVLHGLLADSSGGRGLRLDRGCRRRMVTRPLDEMIRNERGALQQVVTLARRAASLARQRAEDQDLLWSSVALNPADFYPPDYWQVSIGWAERSSIRVRSLACASPGLQYGSGHQ